MGKSTLITHFGQKIEKEGRGIFLLLRCSSNFTKREIIIREILKLVQKACKTRKANLERLGQAKAPYDEVAARDWDLRGLLQSTDHALAKSELTLYDAYSHLNDLAEIVPVFFAADEIQEFQKVNFPATPADREAETALHFFSRLLKDLLHARMFLLLSGTRFHILSQIGEKIGSLIRNKVEPLVLSNFTRENIEEYVREVQRIITSPTLPVEVTRHMPILVDYFREVLFAFSGGHPRTSAHLTRLFLSSFPALASKPDYLEYDAFIQFFLPLAVKSLQPTLFGTEIESYLRELGNSREFSLVKRWVINGTFNALRLGETPEIPERPETNAEIRDLIYSLVNLGVITQNSNFTYSPTSYFHLLAFLAPFSTPHEGFLKQVLHNKYFQQLCGGHPALGITFEHILIAALFLQANAAVAPLKDVPINLTRLNATKLILTPPDWGAFQAELGVLYHLPRARGFDFLFDDGDALTGIQVTTTAHPDVEKMVSFARELQYLTECRPAPVRGWYISLFPLPDPRFSHPPQPPVVLTAGNDLIPLLGEELYNQLKAVKTQME